MDRNKLVWRLSQVARPAFISGRQSATGRDGDERLLHEDIEAWCDYTPPELFERLINDIQGLSNQGTSDGPAVEEG